MPNKQCVEEHRARSSMIWMFGMAIIIAAVIVSI